MTEHVDEEDWDREDPGTVLGPDGPRLCREMCSTCIGRPGNPMKLRPGRVAQMIRETLAGGGFITCHSTLPYAGTGAAPAVCRWFYDQFGHRSNVLRVWGRLGGFMEIDPPSIKKDLRS